MHHFQYIYVLKIKTTTIITRFLNSLIFRPTYLRFFDICLLLVILTMAIHSYREKKEEKAVDVVVAATIYPYIFFFSLISYFFLPYYYTKPKKELLYEHILPSFFFLCALANLKSTDAC